MYKAQQDEVGFPKTSWRLWAEHFALFLYLNSYLLVTSESDTRPFKWKFYKLLPLCKIMSCDQIV